MHGIKLRLTLAVGALLALAAVTLLPQGWEGARMLDAADDPVRLAEIALERSFSGGTATREIEAALAASDPDLAASFVELADARAVPISTALRERVAAANSAAASTIRVAERFAHGLVTGAPDDLAGLAGTLTGDLFVFGDVRDVVREIGHSVRGEEVDELILGLACVGLVVTAGTYATLGAGSPTRVGVSVAKAAGKTGRMSAKLSAAILRPLRESVDMAVLKQGISRSALLQPAVAVRAVRQAVKLEKARDLIRVAGDLGTVQAKAGTRAALDGLKIADSPKDLTRLARLAEASGGKTRAIVKLLGRGAIVLTVGAFQLASWMFWALLNVLLLIVALKRTVERVTLAVIHYRKLRRARHLADTQASCPHLLRASTT
jgi:hypothetical protein